MSDLENLPKVKVADSCDLLDLSCHTKSVLDFFSSFFLWVYESVVLAFADLISSIPLPDFMNQISSYRLPDVVAWAAEPFQLGTGVSIIASAYTLRFIIRRIPVIG